MRVFSFEPNQYRERYSEEGWVHIPQGVSEEFHRSIVEYAERELTDHLLEGFAIKGKKEQALYEFPESVDFGELYDVVASVCGLNRDTMTLSERHIQAYEANAAPEPAAHKDRFPSQVSVGLSIDIPEESRLVLYPYSHRELNPFNTSAGLRRSLQPHELPEVALAGAREVEIADRPRDVVMFPGSTTWHLRRRSARSINLYLKFNDFGCDPLGEDPATPRLRARSLEALTSLGEAELGAMVPVPSRRFDTVARRYTRAGWLDLLEGQVFGEEPFGLTELQFEVLQAADGRRSLAELAEAMSDNGDVARARGAIVYLVEREALDLVPRDEATSRAADARSAVSDRG